MMNNAAQEGPGYQSLQVLPADISRAALVDIMLDNLSGGGRFRLFELNFAEHPDSYVATEDLAWGNEAMGNHQRAIELAEAWVASHPDHELGSRLLSDLRGGRRH